MTEIEKALVAVESALSALRVALTTASKTQPALAPAAPYVDDMTLTKLAELAGTNKPTANRAVLAAKARTYKANGSLMIGGECIAAVRAELAKRRACAPNRYKSAA